MIAIVTTTSVLLPVGCKSPDRAVEPDVRPPAAARLLRVTVRGGDGVIRCVLDDSDVVSVTPIALTGGGEGVLVRLTAYASKRLASATADAEASREPAITVETDWRGHRTSFAPRVRAPMSDTLIIAEPDSDGGRAFVADVLRELGPARD
ncbi:MAG: hypothetical protein U0572_06785 [Phycisphaerales bacterium]